MTSIKQTRTWLLALSAFLFATTSASASLEDGYVLFARNVSAAGADEAEATRRLKEECERVIAQYDTRPKTLMGSRVALSALANVRSEDEPARLDARNPGYRLVGSLRMVVWVGEPRMLPPGIVRIRDRTAMETTAPAQLLLRLRNDPSARRVLRISVREGVRMGFRPTEGTVKSIREESIRMGLGAEGDTPESQRVGGALLRYALKQILESRPHTVGPVAAEAVLRIPRGQGYWHFPFDPKRLSEILGQDSEQHALQSLSKAEVSAFETAYDIMVDPQADPQMRQHMWVLRLGRLPFRPEGKRSEILRLLMAPGRARGIGGNLSE